MEKADKQGTKKSTKKNKAEKKSYLEIKTN